MAETPETLIAPKRPALGAEGASVLGDDPYRAVLSARGAGTSTFEGHALMRGSLDPRDDEGGWFVYLDEAGRLPWSIGAAPCWPADGGHAAARATPGAVTLVREQNGIEARLTAMVVPGRALELRRVILVNLGDQPRTLGITSVFDIVLHEAEADRAHPAFSRLFVQTAWDPARGAVTASRRARDAGESFPHLAHALLEDLVPEYETDRARFLGRTSGRDRPRALEGGPREALAGTAGNVLDPIAALRVRRTLAPREVCELTFVLAAGWSRAEVLAAVDQARDDGADKLLAAALQGPLADATGFDAEFAAAGAAPAAGPEPSADGHAPEPLRYWNGNGGFSADGREYVVRLVPGEDGILSRPPQPWVNVIANEQFGFLVSETGAGTTWSQNSRERRLTPWSNDPLLDPHGEALYVRDEETGVVLSPLPGPAPGKGPYEMRHGLGVSRCRHASAGLAFETSLFVARHDAVKVTRVRITNVSGRPRRLSLVAWQRLVLGSRPEETRDAIVTVRDARTGALFAERPDDPLHPARVAFTALISDAKPAGKSSYAYTCDSAAFLGPERNPARPAALADKAAFDLRSGAGLDPCFAQRAEFPLAAGATVTLDVLLGDAADIDEARALVTRFRAPGACTLALEDSSRFWQDLVSAVRVETPAPALDLMLNGWLVYQTLSCRMWGRSAFYQSGGAFGFRDQLQDASALLAYRPALFREQIVLHARHQFVEGDVLHWWHPPDDRGLRTRFADDLLWLPWLTATYVRATGDASVLDEPLPYLEAPLLEDDEQEVFLTPARSGESGDVYDHACRAIERSLAVGNGAHGLPRFGSGDWNDGMNRVGCAGKGESVWMGFFLATVLADFAPLCEARGDSGRAARYLAEHARLSAAIEEHAWDGAWYRRGYYDDGAPLGSVDSDECRIDALAQAWSVLSGVAPSGRAAEALDAVERELVVPEAGIVKLLAPPFEHTGHDPGYIKGYLPGVRENGGQYTHAALWFVRALAEAGRRDRAAHLLEAMSPVSHTQDASQVARYQVEPYVIAADVYGADPHVGRGGWTWYTGSAGWMIRVGLESILGLTELDGESFVLAPRIPDAWPGFRIERRLEDGTVYEFHVTHPDGPAEGVVAATVDGVAVAPSPDPAGDPSRACLVVPIARDGRRHVVNAQLGPGA